LPSSQAWTSAAVALRLVHVIRVSGTTRNACAA